MASLSRAGTADAPPAVLHTLEGFLHKIAALPILVPGWLRTLAAVIAAVQVHALVELTSAASAGISASTPPLGRALSFLTLLPLVRENRSAGVLEFFWVLALALSGALFLCALLALRYANSTSQPPMHAAPTPLHRWLHRRPETQHNALVAQNIFLPSSALLFVGTVTEVFGALIIPISAVSNPSTLPESALLAGQLIIGLGNAAVFIFVLLGNIGFMAPILGSPLSILSCRLQAAEHVLFVAASTFLLSTLSEDFNQEDSARPVENLALATAALIGAAAARLAAWSTRTSTQVELVDCGARIAAAITAVGHLVLVVARIDVRAAGALDAFSTVTGAGAAFAGTFIAFRIRAYRESLLLTRPTSQNAPAKALALTTEVLKLSTSIVGGGEEADPAMRSLTAVESAAGIAPPPDDADTPPFHRALRIAAVIMARATKRWPNDAIVQLVAAEVYLAGSERVFAQAQSLNRALHHIHAALTASSRLELDRRLVAFRLLMAIRVKLGAREAEAGARLNKTFVAIAMGDARSVTTGSTHSSNSGTGHGKGRAVTATPLHRQLLRASLLRLQRAVGKAAASKAAVLTAVDKGAALSVVRDLAVTWVADCRAATHLVSTTRKLQQAHPQLLRLSAQLHSQVLGMQAEGTVLQEKADRALTAAEETLQSISASAGRLRLGNALDATPDITGADATLSVNLDRDGTMVVMECSAAACEVLGRDRRDVLAATLPTLFPLGVGDDFAASIRHTFASVDRDAEEARAAPGHMQLRLGRFQVWLGWQDSRRALQIMAILTEHSGQALPRSLQDAATSRLHMLLRPITPRDTLLVLVKPQRKAQAAQRTDAAAPAFQPGGPAPPTDEPGMVPVGASRAGKWQDLVVEAACESFQYHTDLNHDDFATEAVTVMRQLLLPAHGADGGQAALRSALQEAALTARHSTGSLPAVRATLRTRDGSETGVMVHLQPLQWAHMGRRAPQQYLMSLQIITSSVGGGVLLDGSAAAGGSSPHSPAVRSALASPLPPAARSASVTSKHSRTTSAAAPDTDGEEAAPLVVQLDDSSPAAALVEMGAADDGKLTHAQVVGGLGHLLSAKGMRSRWCGCKRSARWSWNTCIIMASVVAANALLVSCSLVFALWGYQQTASVIREGSQSVWAGSNVIHSSLWTQSSLQRLEMCETGLCVEPRDDNFAELPVLLGSLQRSTNVLNEASRSLRVQTEVLVRAEGRDPEVVLGRDLSIPDHNTTVRTVQKAYADLLQDGQLRYPTQRVVPWFLVDSVDEAELQRINTRTDLRLLSPFEVGETSVQLLRQLVGRVDSNSTQVATSAAGRELYRNLHAGAVEAQMELLAVYIAGINLFETQLLLYLALGFICLVIIFICTVGSSVATSLRALAKQVKEPVHILHEVPEKAIEEAFGAARALAVRLLQNRAEVEEEGADYNVGIGDSHSEWSDDSSDDGSKARGPSAQQLQVRITRPLHPLGAGPPRPSSLRVLGSTAREPRRASQAGEPGRLPTWGSAQDATDYRSQSVSVNPISSPPLSVGAPETARSTEESDEAKSRGTTSVPVALPEEADGSTMFLPQEPVARSRTHSEISDTRAASELVEAVPPPRAEQGRVQLAGEAKGSADTIPAPQPIDIPDPQPVPFPADDDGATAKVAPRQPVEPKPQPKYKRANRSIDSGGACSTFMSRGLLAVLVPSLIAQVLTLGLAFLFASLDFGESVHEIARHRMLVRSMQGAHEYTEHLLTAPYFVTSPFELEQEISEAQLQADEALEHITRLLDGGEVRGLSRQTRDQIGVSTAVDVPALVRGSPLETLITQDACVPTPAFQTNCSTAFDGVPANGGILQSLLRMIAHGDAVMARLTTLAAADNTSAWATAPIPGHAIMHQHPDMLAELRTAIALGRQVLEDAYWHGDILLRNQAQNTLQASVAGMRIVLLMLCALLVVLTWLVQWWLGTAVRELHASRALLLAVPHWGLEGTPEESHELAKAVLVEHVAEARD